MCAMAHRHASPDRLLAEIRELRGCCREMQKIIPKHNASTSLIGNPAKEVCEQKFIIIIYLNNNSDDYLCKKSRLEHQLVHGNLARA